MISTVGFFINALFSSILLLALVCSVFENNEKISDAFYQLKYGFFCYPFNVVYVFLFCFVFAS